MTRANRFLILIAAQESDATAEEIRLACLAAAYYIFRDQGAEVVLASPEGGAPAIAMSARDGPDDELVRRFKSDRNARDDLADTLSLDQIAVEDFDAAFCIGFSGQIWDDESLGPAHLVQSFLRFGKPVGLVPGRHVDLAPEGAGSGLLVIGDSENAPLLTAQALLSLIDQMGSTRA
jgi:hypothetical protein